MAANTATIALEFGKTEGADAEDLIKSHLLLARIYRTNGRYQSEDNFYQRAHAEVAAAQTLNEIPAYPSCQAYIDLIAGSIHFAENQLDRAEAAYQRAATRCREHQFLRELILASLGLCEVALRRGQTEWGGEFAEAARIFLEESDLRDHDALRLRVLRQLIDYRMRSRDHAPALKLGQEALELARQLDDPEQEVLTLKDIAVVSASRGNYKIGMQYFLRALDRAEQLGFRPEVGQILINIATIYAHLFNYDDALTRYRRVLNEYPDVLDVRTRIVLFNNLGNIHVATDRPEAAARRFEQAYGLASQNDFPALGALARAQLARTALALQNPVAARRHADAARQFFDENPGRPGDQINALNLGELAATVGREDAALVHLKNGIERSRDLSDETNEQRGVQLMADLLHSRGDFERAYRYQRRHSELQEAFNRTQRNRRFLDLEIRHAIREQRQQIEQLKRDNDYQRQLLVQSDQISRQNEELTRVNEDLRRFAYVASHDLKEPLRMIGSYTQLIERMLGQHMDARNREFFGFVREGVGRMDALLNALLKYATVGNKEIERQPVDLNQILEVCLFNLKVRLEETGADIRSEPLPTVRGEQSLLIQLFQNLLSNALKFVPPERTPLVQIWSEPSESADEVILHVRDNGIGIAEEFR